MDLNRPVFAKTGIFLLILALATLVFYCAIPAGASPEYIYTVEVIFKYAFPPSALAGSWLIWKIYDEKILNKLEITREALENYLRAHSKKIKYGSIILLAAFLIAAILTDTLFFVYALFVSLTPYLCLAGLIWLFRLKNQGGVFFLSLLRGVLVWSVLIWLQTNILSCLDLIRGDIIAALWLIFFAILAVFLFRERKNWRLPSVRGWDWIPVIIAFFALIVALAYPPNNYDVLAYHMPRVLHWLQNGSLAPYATTVDRQIGMPPFNSLVALQSYAPYNLDYFVNLGQWLAYTGCVVGVRQITVALGGAETARNAAVIFAATTPAAITQASNTESCLMVSFYLLAMAWTWILWLRETKPGRQTTILFGLSLGFAILSKGSAYPAALPFVLVVAWRCVRQPKTAFLSGLVAASLIIIVNAPHLYRNLSGEGNLVAGGERNILKRPTPATFLNNAIYNFVSNEPPLLANGGRETLMAFSDKLGIRQDDEEIFPFGGLKFALDHYHNSDTYTPNPLQALFVLIVLIAIILKKCRPPLLYTSCVVASFVIFCLILTWHAWVARIQISLFLLAAPVCGLFIASLRKSKLTKYLLLLFCLFAAPPLFACEQRALLSKQAFHPAPKAYGYFLTTSRDELLLNCWPEIKREYVKAVEFIANKKPDVVGVKIGTNGLEYPLWALLRRRLGSETPKIYPVFPDQKETPRYVLDYERIEQEPIDYLPRVLEYKDGQTKILYAPGTEEE